MFSKMLSVPVPFWQIHVRISTDCRIDCYLVSTVELSKTFFLTLYIIIVALVQ